jgi:hypothetical protein
VRHLCCEQQRGNILLVRKTLDQPSTHEVREVCTVFTLENIFLCLKKKEKQQQQQEIKAHTHQQRIINIIQTSEQK